MTGSYEVASCDFAIVIDCQCVDDIIAALTSSLICLRDASAYAIRAWLARSRCVCQCMFMNLYESAVAASLLSLSYDNLLCVQIEVS